MDNKANDWILSTMANPDFTASDFINVGIDSNNTSMYDRDKYLNSSLIQNSPQFLTNGKFDKAKFNSYYDLVMSSYNDLATETSHPETAKALYSYNNVWVKEEKRKKGLDNNDFELKNIYNPDKRNFGIEKIGFVSDATMTPLEIALTLKVWDPDKKKWEESPNDSWLFRNWFDPVVLATWDFDADINGNPTNDPSKVYYQKGLPKVNEETGTYYYEKLNGREPYNKTVLTPFDIITRDGSAANKYDFFDSDGLDKSFVGSLAKNAMRIAPLFIPYVNTAYVIFNIADEMAKVLPIIYKSSFGLGHDDHSLANTIEAFAMLFDNNKTSEAGLQNFFNSESILNMVSDVALLLYEQRWLFTKAPKAFKLRKYDIAKRKGEELSELEKVTALKAEAYEQEIKNKGLDTILKLGGADERQAAAFAKSQIWAENYMKDYQNVGRNLSRYFMAGTSSFQAFLDAKEEGASDLEAAALFWGYFSGMYAIMGTDIGEHVLPELRLGKQLIRDALMSVARGNLTGETVEGVQAAATTAEKVGIFKKMFNKGTELARAMHERHVSGTMGAAAKSIGANMLAEGVEEVSEEVLYDLTKSTFNIISEFTGGTKVSAWDNALERYGQNFFGGFLGGGLFEATNAYHIVKPKLLGQQYDPNNIKANQQLIYQIRNGEKEEVVNSLNYLRKNKMLGNTNLGTKIIGTNSLGEVLYSEATEQDNQNEAAYNLMLQYINNIETVLNKENMNMSDTGLLRGDGVEESDIIKYLRYNHLMSSPVVGKLLQDYNSLGDEFLLRYNKIQQLEAATDEEKRSNPFWLEELDLAKKDLEETRKKREEYFSLENQQYYTGLMLWSGNANMVAPFAHITLRDFAEDRFKKKFSELTEYEQKLAREEYEQYLLQDASEAVTRGYNFFMKLNQRFGQQLTLLGENATKYVQGRNSFLMLVINMPIMNPETGTVEMVEMTIPQIYERMFGHGKLSDEQITEKAKYLSSLENPFDVMRRFTLSGSGTISEGLNVWYNPETAPIIGTDLELHIASDETTDIMLQSKLLMLETFRDNLLKIQQDGGGYVDDLLMKSVLEIKEELLGITALDLKNGVPDIEADMYDMTDAFYNAYNKFMKGLNANNLDQKLLEFLNETQALTEDKDLVDLVVNAVNNFKTANTDFINLNNEINSIALNSITNPIFDVLNDLIVSATGKERNIVQLINDASKRFKLATSGGDISKFILDGDLQYEDFENALLILRQLLALIRAAQTDKLVKDNIMDFNRLMNLISGSNELGEIDASAANTFYEDLEQLKSKITFIMLLHDYNTRQSLVEQTKLGLKLDYISFNILGNTDSEFYKESPGIEKTIDGQPILDDSIRSAIEAATTLQEYSEKDDINVSSEIQAQIAKERMAIENAVYDRVLALLNGKTEELKKEIYKTLFSKYIDITDPSKSLSVNTTALTSEMSVNDVGPMAEMCYLMSILGCKSGDFHYHYKLWMDSNSTNIVPLPAQRANIQFAWAITHNPEMLQLVNSVLGTEKTSHIPVDNAIFLLGVSGAGKTSAVMMIVYLMLKAENPNVTSITCAPLKNLAEKLSTDINVNTANNKEFDKEELFLELFGVSTEEINRVENWEFKTDPESPVEPEQFNITERNLVSRISDNFNTDNPPKYIFIDEVTFFTASELYAIGQYCKKTGTMIISTGDLNQGTNMKTWKVKYAEDLVDTIKMVMMPSPWELTCSMRPSNTAKRDNNNITTQIANNYDIPMFRDGSISNWGEVVNKIRLEVFENAKIKGAIGENGLRGDILRDRPLTTGDIPTKSLTNSGKQEVVRTLKELIANLKEGEKVAYVYDPTDTSIKEYIETSGEFTEDELNNKIELKDSTDFFTQKNIQGSERKYCIIDIDWRTQYLSKFGEVGATELTAENKKAIVDFMKALNTMISRSINGSIIYDNGLTEILGKGIFEEVDEKTIKDIKPNIEMLKAYNEALISIYETLLDGYTPTVEIAPVVEDTSDSGDDTSGEPEATEPPVVPPDDGTPPVGPTGGEPAGSIGEEETPPLPGIDELPPDDGRMPEPDTTEIQTLGPGPENNGTQANPITDKSISFVDFFKNKIRELGLSYDPNTGYIKLGDKILTLVYYKDIDSYNRFSKIAKLNSNDGYTIVKFNGIDGLRGAIEQISAASKVFSILLVDPATITSGTNNLRSNYEEFTINTGSIADAPSERMFEVGSVVKGRENGKDIYYLITKVENKNGKLVYQVKVSENPQIASLGKPQDGFYWGYIPTGLFHMKRVDVVSSGWQTQRTSKKNPSGHMDMSSNKGREIVPVTVNEVHNLIDKNGDLGLKLYSGLATQTTSNIETDDSGKVTILHLGAGFRLNPTGILENLEGILAPFIQYTVGNQTKQFNPNTHYIRTIDNKIVLIEKGKKFDPDNVIEIELPNNFSKIYKDAVDLLTNIRSTLIDVDASKALYIEDQIKNMVFSFYRQALGPGTEPAVAGQLLDRLSIGNSTPFKISYKIKVFRSDAIDYNVDLGLKEKTDKFEQPCTLLVALIGNMELAIAKLAHPKTMMKYIEMIKLFSNKMTLSNDELLKLHTSIELLERIAALAFKIRYQTFTKGYTLGNNVTVGGNLPSNATVYYDVNNLNIASGKLTGALLYDTTEAVGDYQDLGMSYEDFTGQAGIICSDPAILTDKIRDVRNLSNKYGAENIAGKPIVVFTLNKNLWYYLENGKFFVTVDRDFAQSHSVFGKISSEDGSRNMLFLVWRESFTDFLNGSIDLEEYDKRTGKDLIRIVVASPQATNFSGYLNNTFLIVSNIINKQSNAGVRLGNQTTGTRLLHTLFNLLADLIEAININQLSIQLNDRLLNDATIYVGDIAQGKEIFRHGKINLSLDEAIQLTKTLNSLLSNCVKRIYLKPNTSGEGFDKLTIGADALKDLFGIYLPNENIPYSDSNLVTKLHKGLETLIKETMNVDLEGVEDIFDVPFSANRDSTMEAVLFIGEFSQRHTWTLIPFSIANFFSDINEFGLDTNRTFSLRQDNAAIMQLVKFLDENLEKYGAQDANPAARNPLNKGFFYNASYMVVDDLVESTSDEIAYPAQSIENTFKFRAAAQTASLHLSVDLTLDLINQLNSDSDASANPTSDGYINYWYKSSDWYAEALEEAAGALGEQAIPDDNVVPQTIMGSGSNAEPELSPGEKRFQEIMANYIVPKTKEILDPESYKIFENAIREICEIYPNDTNDLILVKAYDVILSRGYFVFSSHLGDKVYIKTLEQLGYKLENCSEISLDIDGDTISFTYLDPNDNKYYYITLNIDRDKKSKDTKLYSPRTVIGQEMSVPEPTAVTPEQVNQIISDIREKVDPICDTIFKQGSLVGEHSDKIIRQYNLAIKAKNEGKVRGDVLEAINQLEKTVNEIAELIKSITQDSQECTGTDMSNLLIIRDFYSNI